MITLSEERDAFVTRMRKRRADLGLSPDEAAELIGVESRALLCWEQGTTAPNLGNLLMWVRVLGCKLEVRGR